MNSPKLLSSLLLAGVLVLGAACESDSAPSGGATSDAGPSGDAAGPSLEGLPTIVAPGKEDNFRSASAQEYVVEGVTTVKVEADLLDADDETKMKRVQELIPLQQVVIGWFLNAYLVEKSSHDSNQSYGGFKALTKNGSYEDLDIKPLEDGLTYEFRFRQEVGGQMDLLQAMKLTPGADGRATFDLTIGKISNLEMEQLETDAEWYRKAPWSGFDPTKVDAERLDKVPVAIWAEPRSEDGWLEYNRLFADGLVTVGIHWGWDYHSEYHLKHARAVFDWLVGEGYQAPVATFDELKYDSGPFTRTIQANGKEVRVEVSLFTGVPGGALDPDTDAGGKMLERMMLDSFRDREVIVFSGHSGPFYAFALANWRKTSEGDIDDSEIPAIEMPRDTYQFVFAEGCDTYGVGQAFWQNPNKPERKNLDVITTTSFSNASTPAAVKDFVTALVGTDASGNHKPQRFEELLKDLDSNSYWFSTMYGVHGIDDNPHIHPYADTEALCAPCTADADCGGGYGMQCTRLSDADAGCAAECTADDGCPVGYACEKIAQGSWISAKYCVPANAERSCSAIAPPPVEEKPVVIINEVLADPPTGAAQGDANGDGVRDARSDEFVEIVNTSLVVADLSGWTVSDGVGVRFTFPAGTTLTPGGVAVVFGGGDRAAFADFGPVPVFVAKGGLGLSNDGDSVLLADRDGERIDRMQYGRGEGDGDRSLVRATDGDPDAPFVQHGGSAPFSAGVKSDGQVF